MLLSQPRQRSESPVSSKSNLGSSQRQDNASLTLSQTPDLTKSSLKDLVYGQLMNNLKLLKRIKDLNKAKKQKEVSTAHDKLVSELKTELKKQSLSCSKPRVKKATPFELYKMK